MTLKYCHKRIVLKEMRAIHLAIIHQKKAYIGLYTHIKQNRIKCKNSIRNKEDSY